jgi:hypothetical protein
MRKVYVVGTRHRYQGWCKQAIDYDRFSFVIQRATQSQLEEFKAYLRDLIDRYQILTVAEEMSRETLKEIPHPDLPPEESVPFQLAVRELKIPHAYCDPDSAKRKELGISDDTAEDRAKREAYWLEQVEGFKSFPCIFVVGSDHTRSFSDLLTKSGFDAKIVIEEWLPTGVSASDVDRR